MLGMVGMFGMYGRGCAMQDRNQAQNGDEGRLIVTAGPLQVRDSEIQSRMQQTGMDMSQLPGNFKYSMVDQMLSSSINSGLALKLAQDQGIRPSDDEIKKQAIEGQISSDKEKLISQGKLKPNPTDAEFDTALKAAGATSLVEYRKSLEKAVDEAMSAPNGREHLAAGMAMKLLANKIKSKFEPTDEQLKAQFDSYKVKRLTITTQGAGSEGPQAKAQRILLEIKKGLWFEQAMDKYSNEPATKGKKLSEQTVDIPGSALLQDPNMAVLATLKPGQVSPPVTQPMGVALYKMVAKESKLPKDFEAQKTSLRDKAAIDKAQAEVIANIKKLDTAQNVKWNDAGYQLLHQYFALQTSPAPDRNTQLLAIVDAGLQHVDSDEAVAAANMAMDAAYSTAPPAQKQSLSAKRLQVLAAYANRLPEISAKVSLAEAYVDAKDAAVGNTLIDAAMSNGVNVNQEGQSNWNAINAAKLKAQQAGLLKPEQAKQLDDEFARWKQDYKQQEDLKAQQEAERKKAEDEVKKASGATAKPAPTPAPTPAKPAPGKK